MPSSARRCATAIVSIGSVPGKKVTFTVVPSGRDSAKLSIFVAPVGVTSIDQFCPARDKLSIFTAITSHPYALNRAFI